MIPSDMSRLSGKQLRRLSLLVVGAWLLPAFLHAEPAAAANATEYPAAEEMDRPGEVENPFSLGAGKIQVVTYLLAANPEAREENELGTGGSVVMLQTGVRVGLGGRWEGQVFVDTFLNAIDKGPDGDDPGRSRRGLGFVTLRAKAEVLSSDTGEGGLALVPFVRIPVSRTLTGRSGAEPGLIAAYDVDLEHGFELQGSSGVTLAHDDSGGRAAEFETQLSLEWHPSPRWAFYIEPQLQAGPGRPVWEVEGGVSWVMTRAWRLDLGYNNGLGRAADARFAYGGVAVVF
jgi:hypothetical protein